MTEDYLRKEAEFFAKIGSVQNVRNKLLNLIETSTIINHQIIPLGLTITFYNEYTSMEETWLVEGNANQIARLYLFLRTFDYKTSSFILCQLS